MKLLITILLLISITGCASHWTRGEKIKYGTMMALQAVDVYQTDRLTKDGHKELNPIINGIAGDKVEWWEITLIKAPMLYGITWMLDNMNHKERNIGLNIMLGISSGVVVWNTQF